MEDAESTRRDKQMADAAVLRRDVLDWVDHNDFRLELPFGRMMAMSESEFR
jgi:hypothetical protein